MKLVCPDCRKKFPWEKNTAFPRFCPLCSSDIGHDTADDDIVMPFIRSSQRTAQAQSADDVYRQMEKGSEVRAQMAAEHLGVSASEMSDLKVTNLKDASRPGEIAAVPVNNAVSQVMAQGVGGFRGTDGLGYSASVQTGAFANSGAKMRTAIHQIHTDISRGSAVCDRPGLETQQPGYRRRG